MNRDSSYQGCCPAHDPCPRHVSTDETATTATRAMLVDGTNGNSLEAILDHRGISRRDLVRFAGLGGMAATFAAAPIASAMSQQSPSASAPRFPPPHVGPLPPLPPTNHT